MKKSNWVVIFMIAMAVSTTPPFTAARASFSGTWSAIGNMTTRRVLHTATLLSDGKVLVAGGLNNGRLPTATTELYDPLTDIWSATGSMLTARSRHTATPLADGRVLVVGGRDASGVSIATAELYDPQTGAWSSTGDMAIARSYHTATLLADGRVLVTGGGHNFNAGPAIEKTAEVYDPNNGTWHFTDHMANARFGHRATLLSDGRVLIAGGAGRAGDCMSTMTAELYDPELATWKPTRPMTTARGFHTMTLLLDGSVLVAGGNTIARQVLIPKVPPICTAIAETVELYDPYSDYWTPVNSMAIQRTGQTATSLADGRMLVVGGRSFDGTVPASVATAEVYSPITNDWSSVGNMSVARAYHTATRLNDGRVLVCGGHSGPTFNRQQLSSAEIYTP
jgi:Galactose oxidase, central domain/Kelch motif